MNFENQQRSGRMDIGAYALNKLAGAGTVLVLLTVISWLLPMGKNEIQLLAVLGISNIPLEHIVYGYAMTASLIADGLIPLLRIRCKVGQAALYAAFGLLFFGGFMEGGQQELWLRAAAGSLMLLGLLWGKYAFSNQSLITPFFALAAPLLCLVLW